MSRGLTRLFINTKDFITFCQVLRFQSSKKLVFGSKYYVYWSQWNQGPVKWTDRGQYNY